MCWSMVAQLWCLLQSTVWLSFSWLPDNGFFNDESIVKSDDRIIAAVRSCGLGADETVQRA